MAKSFALEVVETSSTTSTGNYNLGGIPAGSAYRTFRQEFSNGETKTVYMVRNAANTKWELNEFGTLTYGTPDTLSRNVKRSTNGDAAVSWVSGDLPLTIYIPASAEQIEGSITGWLATVKNTLLRFGLWWKEATPAAGYQQLNHYDGVSNIPVGIGNSTAHKVTLYGTPRGYIAGFALTRASATTVGMNPGTCMDSTNTIAIDHEGITKSVSGAWAAGNNQNGMGNALTVANNTWYHVFAIINAGLVDVYFDTSITAANKPAGTTYFRRVGSFRTNGSAQVVNFSQAGDVFQWAAPSLDYSSQALTGGGTPDTATVNVPPGLQVLWRGVITGFCSTSGGIFQINVGTPGQTLNGIGAVAGGVNSPASTLEAGATAAMILTSTAQGIALQSNAANTTFSLETQGWIDPRGKDG